MLDYSFANSGTFINSYQIIEEGKMIEVNYSSGAKDTIPYTESNLKKIQERMIRQVQNNGCVIRSILASLELLGTGVGLASITKLIEPLPTNDVVVYAGTLIMALIATKEIRYVSDYKKNSFFVKNGEFINDGLEPNLDTLQSLNKIDGISKKGLKTLRTALQERKGLDLNDVNSMKLSDLRILKENIKRFNAVDFEYPEGPVLKK